MNAQKFSMLPLNRFLYCLLFSVWISAMALGWAILPLIGQLMGRHRSDFNYEDNLFVIQSPLTFFILLFCLFQLCVSFTNLDFGRKFLLIGLAYVGSIVMVLVGTGALSDQFYLPYLFQWEWFGFEHWIPIISRTKWTYMLNFLIGNLVSSLALGVLFWRSKFVVTNVDLEEPKCFFPCSPIAFRCTVFICGAIIGYSVLTMMEAIPTSEYDRLVSFIGGISLAPVLFLFFVFIAGIKTKSISRALFILCWIAVVAIFWIAMTDHNSIPNFEFLPAGLSAVVCILFVQTLMRFLKSPFCRLSAAERTDPNKKNADPFGEESGDPFETPAPLPIPPQEKTAPKTEELEEEIKPRFSTVGWTTILAFAVCLTICGHFVPRFFSPFVLATTGDFRLAEVVASARVCNDGKHYVISSDFEGKFSPAPSVKPLILTHVKGGVHSFEAGYQMELEVQPLAAKDPGKLDFLAKFVLQDNGAFLQVRYSENGPNGKIYRKLSEVFQTPPVLNAADLTTKQQVQLIKDLYPYWVNRFKNMHIQKEMFRGYPYFFRFYEFKDCTYEKDFLFSGFQGKPGTIIIHDGSKLNVEQWLNIGTQSNQSYPSFMFVMNDRPFANWFAFKALIGGTNHYHLSFLSGDLKSTSLVLPWSGNSQSTGRNLLKLRVRENISEPDFDENCKFQYRGSFFEFQDGQLVGFSTQYPIFNRQLKSSFAKHLQWLSIIGMDGLNQDTALRSSFDSLPKLTSLKLDNKNLRQLNEVIKKEKRESNIFQSPNLRTLAIDFIEKESDLILPKKSKVETVILDCPYESVVNPFLKTVDQFPNLKRIVFTHMPGRYNPERTQVSPETVSDKTIQQLLSKYHFDDSKIDFFVLENPKQEFDFTLDWKEFQKQTPMKTISTQK